MADPPGHLCVPQWLWQHYARLLGVPPTRASVNAAEGPTLDGWCLGALLQRSGGELVLYALLYDQPLAGLAQVCLHKCSE